MALKGGRATMKNEFDEFNEFDDEDNINDDFSFQDNYYYDEDASFDSTLDDYDYLDYNYSGIDRNEEDIYDEEIEDDMDVEKSNKRNKIVKFVIILTVLLLIIWIISLTIKSTSKKAEKQNEVKVIKTDHVDYKNMFLKTKTAALKYYTEDKVIDSINHEKTLKLLESLEYIKIDSNDFNLNQSYIKLTKSDDTDKFNILIVLIHGNDQKSKTYEVSNYSYCIDSYLCEKQEILGMEETNEETNNNSSNESEIKSNKEVKLSSWSLWSNYERTSCNTQEVRCSENDINCLIEVKLYEQKEKISTYDKVYYSSRLAFSNVEKENISVCNNYDYVKINNLYYRIDKNSNYPVLGAITKDTRANYYNWRYDGRNSYETPPSDTITTRYVYVGPDYSNCANTCKNNPKYFYDKYTFTKTLNLSVNPVTDCNNQVTKIIANYSISKQTISVSRKENLYGTVCYKSNRTRKKIEG